MWQPICEGVRESNPESAAVMNGHPSIFAASGKKKSGAGAAKKIAGSPALDLSPKRYPLLSSSCISLTDVNNVGIFCDYKNHK